MTNSEAKEKLISIWGSLGSTWGISSTMARVHALLLVNDDPKSTEEIMEELSISRGNANMSVRSLIEWNLVKKLVKKGERKEYFVAEKDFHKIAVTIAKERRRREISPLIEALNEIKIDELDCSPEAISLRKRIAEMQVFIKEGDNLLEKLIKLDESKLFPLLFKMLKR